MSPQAACSHPHLDEVNGLYGYYRCPACGDFFNLQLINLVRHSPRDAAAVAHWLIEALKSDTQDTRPHGDGDSRDGVPDTNH
jgi:hypothetical protein